MSYGTTKAVQTRQFPTSVLSPRSLSHELLTRHIGEIRLVWLEPPPVERDSDPTNLNSWVNLDN